eukprot:6211743-Pleurochrysis_carterae.AAC.1
MQRTYESRTASSDLHGLLLRAEHSHCAAIGWLPLYPIARRVGWARAYDALMAVCATRCPRGPDGHPVATYPPARSF